MTAQRNCLIKFFPPFLLASTIFLFSPKIALAQVVINEIMYDFEGSDEDHEWIEVKNIGTQSADLTNWRPEEGGTKHTLTLKHGDIKIPTGGYAVIADNADQFLADQPGFSGTLIDSSFSLSNTGERLVLLETKDGPTSNEVTYSSEWGANGNGRTLQKKDGEFTEGPVGGTPGRENEFSFIPTPTPTPTPISTPTPTPTPKSTPSPRLTLTPTKSPTSQPASSPSPTGKILATGISLVLGGEATASVGTISGETQELGESSASSQESQTSGRKFLPKILLALGVLAILGMIASAFWIQRRKGVKSLW